MMPITVADAGEEMIVRRVGGNPEVKLHLENLGIVPGGLVTLVTVNDGNVILKVKESRIALNKDMAMKIMV
ncbi:ferrous iron transport protein A [Ruminococcaceae bacterium YAD3003]|nr:ferrous iron transport protein A [Ruminococcaceae bacterium YAD3003]